MKPILFNADMVRAILDGRKAVTRRVIKPQPENVLEFKGISCITDNIKTAEFLCESADKKRDFIESCKMPYNSGDILYVRETWRVRNNGGDFADNTRWAEIEYKADSSTKMLNRLSENEEKWISSRWRPSIHMPKKAARIFLRVTNVRIERLQDCGCTQAKDEGCTCGSQFARLWDSTIKKSDLDRYGWNANPWVWVIEFERINKEDAVK